MLAQKKKEKIYIIYMTERQQNAFISNKALKNKHSLCAFEQKKKKQNFQNATDIHRTCLCVVITGRSCSGKLCKLV